MSDLSPNDVAPDVELGHALREALAMPHDGAFVTRMRALVRQQPARGWDDVLAGWFWQGVLAASMAAVLGAVALRVLETTPASPTMSEESVAVQLLDAERPGTDVLMTAMAGIR